MKVKRVINQTDFVEKDKNIMKGIKSKSEDIITVDETNLKYGDDYRSLSLQNRIEEMANLKCVYGGNLFVVGDNIDKFSKAALSNADLMPWQVFYCNFNYFDAFFHNFEKSIKDYTNNIVDIYFKNPPWRNYAIRLKDDFIFRVSKNFSKLKRYGVKKPCDTPDSYISTIMNQVVKIFDDLMDWLFRINSMGNCLEGFSYRKLIIYWHMYDIGYETFESLDILYNPDVIFLVSCKESNYKENLFKSYVAEDRIIRIEDD